MLKSCVTRGDKSEVVIQCHCCNKDITLIVPTSGLLKRQRGDLIQDCFPDMSSADRELFVSATCDDCFNEMFGEED
jgi:hypothetical protein